VGDRGANYATVGFSLAIKLCCNSGGAVGLGPAFNYAHWVSDTATLGAFGWAHYYPSLDAVRVGAGPQASYAFAGVELGPSLFFQKDEPTSVAASVTPFASAGFLWTGARLNLGAERSDPLLELVIGAGYPIGLGGTTIVPPGFGGGRPIRVRGTRRTSGTRAGLAYGMKLRPALVCSRIRRELAFHWQREAELEYSSVAAFDHLALQLSILGASAQLVRRCRAAARDETKHARMCYGLASAYAGEELGPRPLDLRDLDACPNLSQIVYETAIDGCLGEAIAAAVARRKLRAETDPVVRKVLRAIARDEAGHARLAWDVVEWGFERRAICRALEEIERRTFDDQTAARMQRRVAKRLRAMLATVSAHLAA
jgi:hypothetical protein